MKEKCRIYRKIPAILTAIIAGLLVFSAVSAVLLDNALFNTEYNRSLFNKYDIYNQTEKAVSNSLQSYLDTLKASAADNARQQEQLLELADKAVSPAMVKVNLDIFLDGIIKYFKGKTHFLPDVYLNPAQDKSLQEQQTKSEQDDTVSENSLGRIDRINFSVFLMYLGRNDITDGLSAVRFLQFILSWLPLFAAALSLLALLLFILVYRRSYSLMRWLRTAALTIGLCGSAAGLMAVCALKLMLPRFAADIMFFIPFRESVISGYLQSLIIPPALYLSVIGAAMFLSYFALGSRLAVKLTAFSKESFQSWADPGRCEKRKKRFGSGHMRTAVCIALSLILVCFIAVKSEAAIGDFRDKDLNVALDRLKGNGIYTRVIAAKDEIIYSLQVKIVDKEALTPVDDVNFKISGMIDGKKAEYDVKGTSDASGQSEFTAGRGSFRLVFDENSFPGSYVLPSPYVFNIKTAGTTIITVNLEKAAQAKTGIAEIQVLDSSNLPVDRAELTLDPVRKLPDFPGKSFSISNSDGIAVFRVPEGSYTVSFPTSGLPSGYRLPDPFNVDVTSDSTARYTIRLVADSPEEAGNAGSKKPSLAAGF